MERDTVELLETRLTRPKRPTLDPRAARRATGDPAPQRGTTSTPLPPASCTRLQKTPAPSTREADRADSDTSNLVAYGLRHGRRARHRLSDTARRLPGAHCYGFLAGNDAWDAMQEEELGTYYLTDSWHGTSSR